MKNTIKIFLFFLAIVVFINSCKKEIIRIEPDPPFNPFDTIDYSDGVLDDIPIDSNSFLGLHKYIFSQTCAVPGCHDGSFEPDFRTVQSAYNTLVYAPVIKNDADGTFSWRVVPGDTAFSWLYERITTEDEILGRMPLYDTLYPNERQIIIDWILDGAKDVFGQSPTLADFQPTTYGFIAYQNDTDGIRLDTIRADFVSPVQLPASSNVEFWVGIYDTDENLVFQNPSSYVSSSIKISQDGLFNTGVTEIDFEVEPNFFPYYGPSYYDPLYILPYWHHFTINTSDFESGKLYFLRINVQDNSHDYITEIPDDSQFYIMTYFSFVIE